MFETLEPKTAGGALAYPTFEALYGSASAASKQSQKQRKSKSSALRTPALGALSFCMVLAAIAVQQRQKFADLFPSLAPIYSKIGLSVNRIGLEIRNTKAQILTEGAFSVLAIEGQLANVKKQTMAVPALQITISAPDGQPIYQWMAEAPKSHLNAGEVTYFRARLTAPPDQADKVTIHFSQSSNLDSSKHK